MVLTAKDIMETDLLALDEELDVLRCARQMVAVRKGYAMATRGGPGRISGIVTEWDFLEKIVAPGVDPATVPLKQIASPVVRSCAPDTPMDEVATQMADLGIRRMVVRSGDQVVGVISSRHLIARFRQYIDRMSAEIAGGQSEGPTLS
ncbi:MAG TPA: CBS domain-containing protein [Thermoplasmata archaeon]|nr:CBS domain-containing protein [Thermoplasmata archaeon]